MREHGRHTEVVLQEVSIKKELFVEEATRKLSKEAFPINPKTPFPFHLFKLVCLVA